MPDAPPPSDPVTPEVPALPSPERRGLRWLGEGVLVLASVLVGFAVSEFGDYREERALEASVLRAVRQEVEGNLAMLEPLLASHREWQKNLEAATPSNPPKAAVDVLFDARPRADINIGVPLRNAAWNTAISSGALRLLDYSVAAALSEIYGYQNLMAENHIRQVGGTLYQLEMFEPVRGNASIRLMWGLISEVAGNEQYLRDLYRKHLPLLQQAAE
jgi:hypothetical protein